MLQISPRGTLFAELLRLREPFHRFISLSKPGPHECGRGEGPGKPVLDADRPKHGEPALDARMGHRPVSLGNEERGRTKVSVRDGKSVLRALRESDRLGF